MDRQTIIAGILLLTGFSRAQTVADFDSFTLTPNSAYTSTSSAPFQTAGAVFNYEWDNSFGGFWAGGCAYTNKRDSTNGTFANLYGVKAYAGYSNSANYVLAQNHAVIKLKAPYDKVDGFYICNSTYAYKVIKNGNTFSRKFGDTLGTKSGTTIPQGYYPDFFKVTAKGYKNGALKPDSAVFYLADYRFSNNTQDYVVDSWEWFNTSALGSIDSLTFFMYSSDNGSFGMNTPAFFAFDNFTTSAPNPVGLNNAEASDKLRAFPNPFEKGIKISGIKGGEQLRVILRSINGAELMNEIITETNNELNTEQLVSGIYFLEMNSGSENRIVKLVKY